MKKTVVCSTTLLLAIAALRAADRPPMKEGLWSSHTQTTDQPGNKKSENTNSICRNHAYDDHVLALAKKAMASCKTISENSSGGTTTSERECTVTVNGTEIRTKAKATMSETAARSETHTIYTPPMAGVSESTTIMDQKYVGACPAGTAPGDIIRADGSKTNTWNH